MSLIATRSGKIIIRKKSMPVGHHVRLIPKEDRIVMLSHQSSFLKGIQDSMNEYSVAKKVAANENWMVR